MEEHEVTVLKNFGMRLALLRSVFGYSQAQFASVLEIGEKTLVQYENGEQRPPLFLLREITRITLCDLDFLIAGQAADADDNDGAEAHGPETRSNFVSSVWYWETDPKHRISVTCRPVEERSSGNGIIGWTHWDYVGVDPNVDPRWARHLKKLNARRPFEGFVFKGHKGFIKISGKPAFDSEGAFDGYRGYASTISHEQALENWRATGLSMRLTG